MQQAAAAALDIDTQPNSAAMGIQPKPAALGTRPNFAAMDTQSNSAARRRTLQSRQQRSRQSHWPARLSSQAKPAKWHWQQPATDSAAEEPDMADTSFAGRFATVSAATAAQASVRAESGAASSSVMESAPSAAQERVTTDIAVASTSAAAASLHVAEVAPFGLPPPGVDMVASNEIRQQMPAAAPAQQAKISSARRISSVGTAFPPERASQTETASPPNRAVPLDRTPSSSRASQAYVAFHTARVSSASTQVSDPSTTSPDVLMH